jgi:hypothetical protein
MSSLRFEGHQEYGDTGVIEFSFLYNKDRFKILPKYGVPGSTDKLERFMKFVQHVAPGLPDKNPWMYKVNPEQKFTRVFDIYKNGEKLKDEDIAPDAEQMTLPLSASIDKMSSRLESMGCVKEAYALDVVANTLDRWNSNQSNLFFDEVSNIGVAPDKAVEVLDVANKQGLRA